ncbi:universal stress protein [Antrihabitans sp. YC2-6]|uniref:universal stress protein n=1 Tax=Antrihabitans sp. YC2-6 TaxID=2799498 RepID=UPI0018F791B7|nr:universal stress protein [Antrihabitans sp. YC2-6]MBJ8347030.1 universal stress protein [Antrihabitans sp. YC2-6]
MNGFTSAQPIVVGVDGSDLSEAAARWAAEVAQRWDAPLIIAHAVPEPVYAYGDAAVVIYAEVFKSLHHDARKIVDLARRAVRRQSPDLVVRTHVAHGQPDRMLLELSESARLLVVGSKVPSHGTTHVGSTALHAVNRAKCPVVIWRDEGAPLLEDIERVVVGVDGSGLSEGAVGWAFEFASLFGIPLVAAHAWTRNSQGAATASAESAVLTDCLTSWREKYPDVEVTTVAEEAHPANLLAELSRGARLVAVGSHGYGRLRGPLLGSTSQYLLRHAACPLLICRPEAAHSTQETAGSRAEFGT